MMRQDEIDRLNRRILEDGKKSFEVKAELLKTWEKATKSIDGDFNFSLTRNGRDWHTFRLYIEEIDKVIDALMAMKNGEKDGIQQGED